MHDCVERGCVGSALDFDPAKDVEESVVVQYRMYVLPKSHTDDVNVTDINKHSYPFSPPS